MKNTKPFVENVVQAFTRLYYKLKRLEKETVDFGTGDRIFASELHIIQALGKEWCHTVSDLSAHFSITKGAVSQIVTKLVQKGCIVKIRYKEKPKEIELRLTDKGAKVFEAHERLHRDLDDDFLNFVAKIPHDQVQTFFKILCQVEGYFDQFTISEDKNSKDKK